MCVSACEVFPKPLCLSAATRTQDVHLLDMNFIEMRGCGVLGGISVKVLVTSTPPPPPQHTHVGLCGGLPLRPSSGLHGRGGIEGLC